MTGKLCILQLSNSQCQQQQCEKMPLTHDSATSSVAVHPSVCACAHASSSAVGGSSDISTSRSTTRPCLIARPGQASIHIHATCSIICVDAVRVHTTAGAASSAVGGGVGQVCANCCTASAVAGEGSAGINVWKQQAKAQAATTAVRSVGYGTVR